jgi:hypothetical protein
MYRELKMEGDDWVVGLGKEEVVMDGGQAF